MNDMASFPASVSRRRLPIGAIFVSLLCLAGCAGRARGVSHVGPALRSPASTTAPPARRAAGRGPSSQANEGAALVTRSLRERGLTFGTDGTMGAVYAYLRDRHQVVPPAEARPGDIVFFDLTGDGGDCGGHGGVIEEVDETGRIEFRERRAGAIRRSFAHPGEPVTRRDERGRLLNTFLRPRRQEDPPATRYFAGEMLCAVARPQAAQR